MKNTFEDFKNMIQDIIEFFEDKGHSPSYKDLPFHASHVTKKVYSNFLNENSWSEVKIIALGMNDAFITRPYPTKAKKIIQLTTLHQTKICLFIENNQGCNTNQIKDFVNKEFSKNYKYGTIMYKLSVMASKELIFIHNETITQFKSGKYYYPCAPRKSRNKYYTYDYYLENVNK